MTTIDHLIRGFKDEFKNQDIDITRIENSSDISNKMMSDSDHFLVRVKRIPAPPPFSKVQKAPSPIENNEATRVDADDVPFLIENAAILLQAGEVELARNIYRAVLRTGESSETAYAGLAECADRLGFIDQAIEYAQSSVAFAPNQKGYQILSQLLMQQGRDREAVQVLNRALKALQIGSVDQAHYLKAVGNCYSRLGDYADSERAYRKALELAPDSDETQANLGSVFLEQGRNSEAKRCYQDAVASNADNDKAWVGLGLCAVAEGDKEGAHDAFARALELNIKNSTAIFHLVKCAYEIKRYAIAEKILGSYVDIAPVSPSLLYSLAGLQFHVGKHNEATSTAKRILQMKSDHAGARDLIDRIEAENKVS
jgi:tetratricopeptide (TPR) repeat protein